MLAQYLGEDQMLAIVCRNYAASDLGQGINGGYLVFCLDDIITRSQFPWFLFLIQREIIF